MARKKAIIIMPRLHDSDGDMSKKWFVEYSCRNPRTEEMKRFRVYEGLQHATPEERYASADKIIEELSEMLINGKSPFSNEKVIYEDDLMYDHAARMYGRQKKDVVNIRTYMNEFLVLKKKEVIHHSYQTYKSKLRIFIMYLESKGLQDVHVSFITQEIISNFVCFIAENNHVSRRTVLKYQQILKNFFNYLIDSKKILIRNPVFGMPVVGEIKDEAAVPIPDHDREVFKLYMQNHDPQLWLVCMMEFYCALRPHEELRNLLISDLNWDSQTITIRNSRAKNRKTQTVDIPHQLYEDMINVYHLDEYPPEYYVFSRNGLPGTNLLGKNYFKNHFAAIRNALGLPSYYKLYGFKHTGACKLADFGVSTYELQRHMRHVSISTTEAYINKRIGVKSDTIRNNFPDI
jgi:Site-specific recombinase XerD